MVDEHVPKSKNPNDRYPPWFSKPLIRVLKEKEKLRARYKKYDNPRDHFEYRILEGRSKAMMNTCYKNYVCFTENSIRHNPKFFWSFVKIKNAKSNDIPSQMCLRGETATAGDEVCNLFAKHFSSNFTPSTSSPAVVETGPSHQHGLGVVVFTERDILKALKKLNICKGAGPDGFPPLFVKMCASSLSLPLKIIFNCSIATSQFPSEWKMANVVPIFKKGDSDDVQNYRPISLLSVFAKIFESLICPLVTSLISPQLVTQQHGFRNRKSTTTNLVHYVNQISELMDSGAQVDSIYTDFSSAFDRVDHKILLAKLERFGIFGNLLDWFESYLTKRQQKVVIKGYESPIYFSTSGVPQGSHLGPILFLMFVNDIVLAVKHSNCSIFADDLKIYKKINSSLDARLLQGDLDAVHNWCTLNRMSLNVSKCYHITFTKKRRPLPTSYSINGVTLQKVETIRDLGVHLDSRLTFIHHIDNITARAARMSGFIKRICRDFQSISTLKVLFYTLVRSVLDYASPVWNPTYRVHVNRIERIQRSFTRYLCFKSFDCPRDSSYGQRLSYFKICSLENRREVTDLIFLHKLVNGSLNVPDLLANVSVAVPRRSIIRSGRATVTFVTSSSRTNLGSSAPMNRLMGTYNKISARTSSIDIFSNPFRVYRRLITSSESQIVCVTQETG